MPKEFPNLAGIATSDLVETIGAGNFKASYINWSRTMHLLRENAPGWMIETEISSDNGILHRSPNGAYLSLRFTHLDGTTTPYVPQAVMDYKNQSIPYEKITSRDITDTHRRGCCLLAALQFGLAYELWAKLPLENGYNTDNDNKESTKAELESAPEVKLTQDDFLSACLEKGLNTFASEALLKKINGNFKNGINTLNLKDKAWVEEQNKQSQELQQKPAEKSKSPQSTKAAKHDPEEY